MCKDICVCTHVYMFIGKYVCNEMITAGQIINTHSS